MRDDAYATARDEGQRAHSAGAARVSCPYAGRKHKQLRRGWLDGWDIAALLNRARAVTVACAHCRRYG